MDLCRSFATIFTYVECGGGGMSLSEPRRRVVKAVDQNTNLIYCRSARSTFDSCR